MRISPRLRQVQKATLAACFAWAFPAVVTAGTLDSVRVAATAATRCAPGSGSIRVLAQLATSVNAVHASSTDLEHVAALVAKDFGGLRIVVDPALGELFPEAGAAYQGFRHELPMPEGVAADTGGDADLARLTARNPEHALILTPRAASNFHVDSPLTRHELDHAAQGMRRSAGGRCFQDARGQSRNDVARAAFYSRNWTPEEGAVSFNDLIRARDALSGVTGYPGLTRERAGRALSLADRPESPAEWVAALRHAADTGRARAAEGVEALHDVQRALQAGGSPTYQSHNGTIWARLVMNDRLSGREWDLVMPLPTSSGVGDAANRSLFDSSINRLARSVIGNATVSEFAASALETFETMPETRVAFPAFLRILRAPEPNMSVETLTEEFFAAVDAAVP